MTVRSSPKQSREARKEACDEGAPPSSQSGFFSGIQQRFQDVNEIAARSQFSADPFGTLIFPPEGEAGPPQFIPGNASAGGLEFIAGPLRGLSAGRALIRGKEALGFLPSKIGGGGKLQPFSRLTGQFVPFAKTFEGRLLALSTSNAGSLTAGAAQGVLSGISGADLPPAITTRQRIGQIGGQIAAPLIGPFIGF